MALIMVGLRLAIAGGPMGRLRALMMLVGPATGTVVLLFAVSAARLVPAPPGGCGAALFCRSQQVSFVVFLAAAVIVLLATIARLSAATRDRRLAGLRLLGTSAGQTRAIAAGESGVLAALGTAVGAVAFLFLRSALRNINFAGVPGFFGQLHSGLLPALIIVAAVPVLTIVVSLLPTRRITAEPLAVRRESTPGRPKLWRLAPLGVGLVLLTYGAFGARAPDSIALTASWLSGIALVALGLPLAVPIAVRLAADVLAQRGPALWLRLAGRRLQLEPAASTRVVAALVTGLMLVIGFQSVIASVEQMSGYTAAVQAETTGPQEMGVRTYRPFARADLLAVPGVRSATPSRFALYAPGSCVAAQHACVGAYIGTCADLRVFMPGLGQCSDDAVALLGSKIQPPPGPIKLVAWGPGGQDVGQVIPFSVNATQRWPVDLEKNVKPDGSSEIYDLFVPVATAGLPVAAAYPDSWSVTADGGPDVRQALERALQARDPHATVLSGTNTDILLLVPRMRALLYAATWVVLLVGFLAFALAAIDRAAERRRCVVGLQVIGVPGGVIRRSQLVQTLLPLVIGLPLAGAAGLLTGQGYLRLAAGDLAVRMAGLVILAALLTGVALTLLTLPIVSRRVPAELLRRE